MVSLVTVDHPYPFRSSFYLKFKQNMGFDMKIYKLTKSFFHLNISLSEGLYGEEDQKNFKKFQKNDKITITAKC